MRCCRCRRSSDKNSQRFWRYVFVVLLAVPLLWSFALRHAELDQITQADHLTVQLANYIGDASFSVTGSLAAGMEGMDLLGCIVVGFVTALGGGTIRSLLLGQLPEFWLVQSDEYLLCVIVSGITFVAWPSISRRLRLTGADEWLFWTDTLGLAVFASTGAYTGCSVKEPMLHFFACATCGMITATFGGLTRDVLIARPPRILYSHAELYAIPAFLGGCATTALVRLRDTYVMESIFFGTLITAVVRVVAQNYGLRLPTFPADLVFSLDARPRDAALLLARGESFHMSTPVDPCTSHSPDTRSFIV